MTIIIFIIILAILVLVHELGHFLLAKKTGIRVDEFGIGFPPKIFSWRPKGGETRYSINLIPFGGFVKIFGENPGEENGENRETERSFQNKPKRTQILVLSAGVIFNIIFAWILITGGFLIGLPSALDESNIQYAKDASLLISGVLPDSPAEKAGLQAGDSIVSIEVKNLLVTNPDTAEVRKSILESGGEGIALGIEREGVLETKILEGEEKIVEGGVAIGILMENIGIVRLPFFKAFWEGTKITGNLLVLITVSLANFIVDAFSGSADFSQVAGPVGIAGLAGQASRQGFVYLLSFTALISLHLSVLNLIPFPALDGGRILFIVIEKLKGSPINPKIQNWANGAGFALLILLMVIVTWNDIARLF
ncbi:RIP metalloprotease RseP [Candidatus Campbellbacteria bacterium CG11_big_fil_rev_8_21_14_0_20_44_21]|uniref:Zinc metalloprotease n=1 Tax=Candidatus Campbellbacteria bacterium CG22_combo_CG10-13_8_21_14_all_43_18 TaxID=1974530 RepID=A0A2H0DW22_9BACT|nr:MAG: RIP metalloprotease RseP [Candidatus Campbellbacteria bacterium CG22_combo_CG10-13_8_21_14_all_43_18]PIR24135.1 MAG: RIP metalloprotease RseP [Candidatus Campbellbacteria bacterium CG11_big_fil_rev_8_21_14_0_20_44_21]